MPARKLTLAAALALATGCSPPPPAAPAKPAPSAAPVDRYQGRRDAALMRALSQIAPPEGDLVPLSAASRAEVDEALASQSADIKAALARGDGALAQQHVVLSMAAGARTTAVLHGACCRGGVSKDLLALRAKGAPSADLPGSVQAVVAQAAKALAADVRARAEKAASMSVEDARLVADLARPLQAHTLRNLANQHLAELEPTSAHLVAAAVAASDDLDVDAATKLLARARAVDASAKLGEVEADIERARKALTRGAKGEKALDAAVAALQLGRADVARTLLDTGDLAGDKGLRHAVARMLADLDASLCAGLERSRDNVAVCPIVWATNPHVPRSLASLDAAYATRAGRDAWSLESFAGLRHVIPLSFGLLAGASTPDAVHREMVAHLDGVREAVSQPETESSARRDSVLLFVDALRRGIDAAFSSPIEFVVIPEAERNALMARTQKLLDARGDDGLAQRTALAVATLLSSTSDTTGLVARVKPDPQLALTHAMVQGITALRYKRDDLIKSAIAALEQPPDAAPPPQRQRARLLAAALRVARSPGKAELSALESTASDAPVDSLPPSDTLERVIDRVGAVARLGRPEDASQLFTQFTGSLRAPPSDRDAREMLSLLKQQGHALLCTTERDPKLTRCLGALDDDLSRDDKDTPPEARLYRGLLFQSAIDAARKQCRKADRACKKILDEKRARADADVERGKKGTSTPHQALIAEGLVSVGGSSNMSVAYSLGAGLHLVVEVVARQMVLVPPKVAQSVR